MKKFLALFLTLGLFSFVLVGCTTNNNITFGNEDGSSTETSPISPVVNTATNNNDPDSSKTSNLDPQYVSTTYQISEKALTDVASKTTVEAVDGVIGACVSITSLSSTAVSRGAGVLFSYDEELGFSYIVTCFHVIDGYKTFTVTDDNSNEYDAYLVGGYADEDLAVLAIKKTGLTYVSILDDSDTLKRGSDVICIGNPLGTLPNSVSKGVVAYVNREIQSNSYTYRTLIQTDVAINSGNSGGGLFNDAGLLVGIVSNKYSSASIDNLGFAVPSNYVLSTVKSILNTARYDKANDLWQAGYVEGDYNFGFTISLGQRSKSFWSFTYVIYISSIQDNETASGVNALKENDIVESVTVKYKDQSKEEKTYTVTNLTSSTATDIMVFLNDAELSIGDTLSFVVTRNNESKTVEFELVQYVYSI